MKILYSVTGAVFGGAVAHVLSLMRADIASGHNVGLVAAPEPRLMSEVSNIGAEVFPNPHFIRSVKLHEDILSIWPVFQAIRKFEPDIISAHSTKAGYAARLAGFLLGKPVIFTAHGWPFAEGRSLWKRCLLVLAEWLVSHVTAAIICVSDYDRRLALKNKVAPAKKLVLVHNGVDPSRFLGASGEAVREEFKLKNVPVLAMGGRLASQKDPLTLLKACKLLEADFKLIMVGDGELRSQLESFVIDNDLEKKVVFTGERKDIPEILAASDIFVLASKWEGLPLAIIEAGFAGLPSVATDVGGVSELIEDGVTGFIVPPGSPKALADALQRLLNDAELYHRFGSSAREKTLREFTIDKMLTRTHQLYEDILKEYA